MSLKYTKGVIRSFSERIARPAILEVVSECDARADLTAASDVRTGLGAVIDAQVVRIGEGSPPVVGHDDVHWISRDGAALESGLTSLFARIALDIVHTHRTSDLTAIAPTARKSGVPCLVHSIVSDSVTDDERELKRLNELAERFDVVLIAPSVDVASRLGAAEDVAIVPASIDCTRYRPSSPSKARQKTGLPEEPQFIGCATPAAGLKPLFEALTSLDPDVHVALFGPAFPGTAERRLVRELNLDERVHVLGGWALPELIHQAIDVYYQGPSGGCGDRPVLAAQACGKPVVAIGPMDEGKLCPQTGILLTSQSSSALADALSQAISVSPATAARSFVEEYWSFAPLIGAYESVFRSAVELFLAEHDPTDDAAAGSAG